MTAMIAGLIYLQIRYDQDGIQNIAGVYFFLVTSASFNSLQGVIFVSIVVVTAVGIICFKLLFTVRDITRNKHTRASAVNTNIWDYS